MKWRVSFYLSKHVYAGLFIAGENDNFQIFNSCLKH